MAEWWHPKGENRGLVPRSSVTQQLFEGLGVHVAGLERKLVDFWQVLESKWGDHEVRSP